MEAVKDAAAMTADEARAAREVLGLSQGHLAAELGVVPDVVAAFEAGTVRVPARVAGHLRWRVAIEQREHHLAAAGHPPCPVSVALGEQFTTPGAKIPAIIKEFEAHVVTCPQCRAREAYAASLPPLPPGPSSATGRAFRAFAGFTERLPAWARPAAWVAVGIGALVLLRVIVQLVRAGLG